MKLAVFYLNIHVSHIFQGFPLYIGQADAVHGCEGFRSILFLCGNRETGILIKSDFPIKRVSDVNEEKFPLLPA